MDIYDIWFSRVQISNSIKNKLLSKNSSKELWSFKKQDFIKMNLKEQTINQILNKNYRESLEKYKEYLLKKNIKLLSFKDTYYPEKLLNISDFPAYIYVRGNEKILDDDSVAIIGARRCSNSGKILAFNTAKELGDKNINIVSGLALGIDTYAHKGCLKSLYRKNNCCTCKWIGFCRHIS